MDRVGETHLKGALQVAVMDPHGVLVDPFSKQAKVDLLPSPVRNVWWEKEGEEKRDGENGCRGCSLCERGSGWGGRRTTTATWVGLVRRPPGQGRWSSDGNGVVQPTGTVDGVMLPQYAAISAARTASPLM